jgi:hypothetical protein
MCYIERILQLKAQNIMKFSPILSLNTYLDFTSGDIIVNCGPDAGKNLRESLMHAAVIRHMSDVDTILYVNLPFGPRRFTMTMNECYPNAENDGVFHKFTVPGGDLYKFGPQIQSYFEQSKKGVLFINAWEFASKGYRQREELLYFLNTLRTDYNVSIFIYCHADGEEARPGVQHYRRRGLGKLAVFADKIYLLPKPVVEAEEAAEVSAVEAVPVETLLREMQKIVHSESEQPSVPKINELDIDVDELAVAT